MSREESHQLVTTVLTDIPTFANDIPEGKPALQEKAKSRAVIGVAMIKGRGLAPQGTTSGSK